MQGILVGRAHEDTSSDETGGRSRYGRFGPALLRLLLTPTVLAALLLAVLLAAMLLVRPVEVPPLWFDEGVNLSVARNWSELGCFCLLQNGRPVAPDLLSAGVPVVLPITLSFRVLGVGAWQGRLPGALFTVLAMALSYYLAARLYSGKAGLVTLFVQLLLSATHSHLHPVLLGRQALGEMPALAYLLGGYTCLSLSARRPRLWLPLAVLLWGLAIAAKPQFLPFFALSLLLPLALLLLRRDRRWRQLLLSLVGALLVYGLLNWLLSYLAPGLETREAGSETVTLSSGLATKLDLILVSDRGLRITILKQIFEIALPALLGLAWAAWRWLRAGAPADCCGLLSLALWAFVAGWLFWWTGFSIGWLRYLFPGLFTSAIFAAALLHDLIHGLALPGGPPLPGIGSAGMRLALAGAAPPGPVDDARPALGGEHWPRPVAGVGMAMTSEELPLPDHHLRPDRANDALPRPHINPRRAITTIDRLAGVAIAAALLWQTVPPTLRTVRDAYTVQADRSLFEFVDLVHAETPAGGRIETYETELFFLLDRPYHYPPNAVQDQLNRRHYLGKDVPITYDPLAADPDYLVVGAMARSWRLYDPLLESGAFRLLAERGPYSLYARVR